MSDYDYVIVGAGSAGCVLANRLSAEGAEVLLVEAGGADRSPKIKIPAAFAQQFRTGLDWDYLTGPEPGLRGTRDLRPARQGARRVELDERDALRARPPRRLRRLARRRGLRRLGLGRRAPVLPALRAPRGRAVADPRLRRAAQRRPAPLAAQAHRPDDRRGPCEGLPARPRLQRRLAERRLPRRDDDQERAPLERRRRLPQAGAGPPQPDRRHRIDRDRARAQGRARDRRQARRQGALRHRPGPPRGDPRRRGDRLAAAADALRDRRPGQAPGGGRGGAGRAPRGRVEPPGPPLHRLHLGVGDRALAARRREAGRGARVAAAPQRAAHLDRGRGVRLHPLRRRGRATRPPVPPRARLLRRQRLRGARRARADDGAGADRAASARRADAAQLRSDGEAADGRQPPRRAGGHGGDAGRGQAGPRDGRERAARAGARPRDLSGARGERRRGARARHPASLRAPLPPGRDLPDGRRRRLRRRPRAAGPRRRGAARDRRLGDADDHPGQHERPDDDDRREGRRPGPRKETTARGILRFASGSAGSRHTSAAATGGSLAKRRSRSRCGPPRASPSPARPLPGARGRR